MKTIKSAYS